MNKCGKIGLGTVQWGMPYGITNRAGRPDTSGVCAMLEIAHEGGCDLLDTAHAYGDAERMIGEQGVYAERFRLVTKTVPLKGQAVTDRTVAAICAAFELSLLRLQRDSVYGLLVHHVDDLLAENSGMLWQSLERFKKSGQVTKLGVSVYHPDQLRLVLDRFPIELVQLPYNIYDQRFTRSGLLTLLKQRGVEVHVRSAFLQGLLLLPAEKLTGYFVPFRPQQERVHLRIQQLGLTPYQACLNFCLSQNEVDRVIVGCETPEQVKMLVNACADLSPLLVTEMQQFGMDDEALINPSKWPKQN
jgi:aryl-alcohol dehydrogenase-like predicted oxidoreductase